MEKKKVGFIVNPLAGIGGKVGLKGSDGIKIVEKALSMGAVPEASKKAKKALERIMGLGSQIKIVTYPGPMGEIITKDLGFETEVLGTLQEDRTTPQDTENAAIELKMAGVGFILFAGGDGTARNIYNAIGNSLPVIGIPAGVKIHSGVYADTPAHAGDLALLFLSGSARIQLKEAEVMDIDEEAFRQDRLSTKLYGYMTVPNARNLMQSAKAGSVTTERESMISIASHIITHMENDVCYIIGPGTTTRVIMDTLNLKNTLLGVDVVLDRQLIGSDVNENGLLELLNQMENKGIQSKIIVTVIGGQGYVFGRGNQQISDRVIRRVGRENLIIVATEGKMIALNGKPLLVDTGNEDVNKMLSGYVKVITAMNREMAYRLTY
ncbi:MAG: ATP-NAD kinase family protein [Eubacteriales bacterium]|nr:ATP-NAD kinase family protein [Eubacteriales bacterium]